VSTAEAPQPALQKQIEDLDQQVRILSRKQELDKEAAAAKAAETPTVTAGKDGFALKSADDAFQLRFRGLVQADFRDYFESNINPTPPEQFLMRRVRPVFEGTFYEKFAFLIRAELAGTVQLLDAYVDANLWPELRFRAGKFKSPTGLERLQNPAWLQFAERAFPTNLVPNRDIGAQLFGDLFDGTLSYQAGAFDGAVDGGNINNSTQNSHVNFAGRLFAHPFKNSGADALRGLGIGIAYTTGDQNGTPTSPNLPTYLTPGQQNFFTYSAGAFANGNRTNLSPQFYYYKGPFGLFGEYVSAQQTVTRSTNTQDVGSSAWQLYATWVLTGEDASYSGVNPRNPFDWKARRWGAFDVNARVSQLTVDNEAFIGSAATRLANPNASARKATDFGLSMNWYLNRNIKLQLTYDQTSFEGGAPGGADQDDEKILFTRFQAHY
jgi:phosphate-selective porin OprO/OprP